MSVRSLRSPRVRTAARTTPLPAGGSALAMSALRPLLDTASSGTHWVMNPDGIPGRALWMDADRAISFPMRLSGPGRLCGRVMLLPHDWRDGDGALRATVTISRRGAGVDLTWGTVLLASDRGRPRGDDFDLLVPGDATAITLSLAVEGPLVARGVTRAVWVAPMLSASWLPAQAPPAPAVLAAEGQAGRGPVISVLTPVHNPPLEMLEEAIASVTAQTYPHWELCLIDDGSTDPAVITALQRHAASDPRIHLARHDTAQGISAATNHALQLAHGDYIALLDHDDTLTPDALHHVAQHIHADPTLDMLYSDEDIVLDGRRIWLHVKPGWSPDTLRTNGYTCHLGVYRRELVQAIGGFRTEFNGSQDVDMILRLTERTDRVANIPRVLYHWRAHASSTAGGDAKPYAYVAARNAIADHLGRLGVEAEVGYGPPGLYRVAHRVDRGLSVDIAAAITSLHGLADAARSWATQPHPSWQLTLTAPTPLHTQITHTLHTAGIPPERITLTDPHTENPHHALAHAAALGHSPHLLLMTSPAQGLTHDWLTRLLGYSHQPGITAAAPIVLAPDGRIQHAGIAMPTGTPLHILHGARSSMDDFFGYGTSVYNVLALSGIVMTSRESLDSAGGLDPALGELAVVGYTLRATAGPERAVIVPDARLRTTGPDPTLNDLPAMNRLRQVWAATHGGDPYYNPSWRTDRGDFEVTPA